MKKIKLLITFFACIAFSSFFKAQSPLASATCYTPTLGIYDASSGAGIADVMSCNNAGIFILPTSSGSFGNATTPCLRFLAGPLSANSTSNNSLTISQPAVPFFPASTKAIACPTCAFTFSNNSFSYFSNSLLDPTVSHTYNVCNISTSTPFTYTVTSCYNSIQLAAGTISNNLANNCVPITIPANSIMGIASHSIIPSVPSTASLSSPTGVLFLNPSQMAAGIYTVTYFFDSQVGCTATSTKTLQITNPYNAAWSAPAPLCNNAACLDLTPLITGNGGGTFSGGVGVSSGSFCPASSGAGTFAVTYSVGSIIVGSQCGASFTNNIIVDGNSFANAGPTKSITCNVAANPTLNASGGSSYSWSGPSIISGGGSANPVVGAVGIYTVVVTNTAGCTSTSTVAVVNNTTAPNVSGGNSSNLISCTNPQSTVSVFSNPSYTYSWVGPSIVGSNTGPSITVNAGGGYTVIVTNTLNSCTTSSLSVSVSSNTTITNVPSIAGTVTCLSSGLTMSTTASGPYSYTWTAPAGSTIQLGPNSQNATAISTAGGNFTITVYNNINGCTSSSVVAPSINQTPPSVIASNSGSVNCITNTVNLTSTSTGISYNWLAPSSGSIVSGGTSSVAVGSGGGTYTLVGTSSVNGCTNSAVTTVNSNTTTPTAAINNSPIITCFNPVVTISGGPAAGVSYSWSAPATGSISGSATNSIVNVSATGVYSLVVTNLISGCSSISPATVNITSNLVTPTITTSNQVANLVCGTSSVLLVGSAIPGGCTYTWTSSGGGFQSGVNSNSVAASSPTIYTQTATHPVTGCTSSLNYTVNPATNAPSVSLTIPTGTLTCLNSLVTTTAVSNPSSGVSYNWAGPGINGSSNVATVTGSLAGAYNLTVTNISNGCETYLTYNIVADNAPIVPNTFTTNAIDCISTTATITSNPSPPASGYTYTWSTSANSSSISVSPTSNTVYTVTVANPSNGCVGTETVLVTANTVPPSNVSLNSNNVQLVCPTQTAQIIASATGAQTYSWIAPSTGSIVSGMFTPTVNVYNSGSGTFSLIVIGANGCKAPIVTANVYPNINSPTFNFSNPSPSITCNNAIPSVSLIITSTVAIQSYAWGPSAGIVGSASSSVVTFSAAGIYTCLVTANNGCSTQTLITIGSATTAPSIVAGTGTVQPISCINTSVVISPSFSPSTNLNYAWSGPGILLAGNTSTILVNQPGTYNVVLTNVLTGCSSGSLPITVSGTTVAPVLTISSTSSVGISCQPNTNTVTLTASTPGSLTYSWSNGATTSTINTSTPGTYTLSVIDNNSNCSSTQTISVANNTALPTLTASATGTLPCVSTGTISLNAMSSNTNLSYSWTGPSVVSGSNLATANVNAPGIYTVVVADLLTACSSTQTVAVNNNSVLAQFNQDITSGFGPLIVNFIDQSIGATTYSWSFGNGGSTLVNPSNTFNSGGNYTVVLIASNSACSSTAQVVINVFDRIGIVPEVITPNGDGKNDFLEIKGLDSYPNNNLQVFNRWGNEVYKSKPYKNDWDGTPNASGKTGSSKLSSGTYYYILELGDDDKTILRGFVQLQY